MSLSESLVVWLLWFEVWHQIRLEPIVPSTNDVRRSSLDRTLQWEYFHNFPSSVAGVNDFFFLLIIIVFDVFKVFFKLQSLVSSFKHTHATSYRASHIESWDFYIVQILWNLFYSAPKFSVDFLRFCLISGFQNNLQTKSNLHISIPQIKFTLHYSIWDNL